MDATCEGSEVRIQRLGFWPKNLGLDDQSRLRPILKGFHANEDFLFSLIFRFDYYNN
jgi:hypothetical protein